MKLHPMWENYPALSKELTETLKRMEETVRLKNKPVEQAIKETIHAGGKLLRPAYQLLFSQFGSEQRSRQSHRFGSFYRNAPYGHTDP